MGFTEMEEAIATSVCTFGSKKKKKNQLAKKLLEYVLSNIQYGHVSHSSGLAKTILQGTVKGGRRQGRQRKRWEDNIKEWTGVKFTKSQRAGGNREKWRKLVVKSSVAPRDEGIDDDDDEYSVC